MKELTPRELRRKKYIARHLTALMMCAAGVVNRKQRRVIMRRESIDQAR